MTDDLINILGPEQSLVDESLPDAGIPPVLGVHSFCVFRASRDAPELTDGLGYTYHHHVDMACWKGRLYVGWNSCQRDEDVWPSRELYSTSADGIDWSPPAELFPQGLSTCLRMYFYHAANGVMLAIAGLRAGTDKVNEDAKGALLVRRINADHSLGEVYTLQSPRGSVPHPPHFELARELEFSTACRSLLADTVFLEQQDRGRLLGDRRMKWHDPAAWPGGKVPGDSEKWVAGKAFSFFIRPDGAIVGVSKMGWTTISLDRGKTWRQPEVPPTLVTGKAKVWAQRTRDGRFVLVYNPSRRNRYPLVIVTSDDGINFTDMRLVQGELPIQRYAGADRSIGPQYTRGISAWADDGSRPGERALWVVYSMSKEDIWVSRIPLPVETEETNDVHDDGDFRRWNLHQPKWSEIDITGGSLRLENRDPYDYPIATRVFPSAERVRVAFTLEALSGSGVLEIDLTSRFGSRRPVRLLLSQGELRVGEGAHPIGRFPPGAKREVSIGVDCPAGRFSIALDGTSVGEGFAFAEPSPDVQRIAFRAGRFRGVGGKKPVVAGTDRPIAPIALAVWKVRVESRPFTDR